MREEGEERRRGIREDWENRVRREMVEIVEEGERVRVVREKGERFKREAKEEQERWESESEERERMRELRIEKDKERREVELERRIKEVEWKAVRKRRR